MSGQLQERRAGGGEFKIIGDEFQINVALNMAPLYVITQYTIHFRAAYNSHVNYGKLWL